MKTQRKPDIVCIGAQKAGTSWLHELLATRSDVWVPPFKELHFFDYKFIAESRRWVPWHIKQGVKAARERHVSNAAEPDFSFLEYLKKLETEPRLNKIWYQYVFSKARVDQKCLDVTPEYSCIPDIGINYFKRFLPEAKLIFLVRDPLERLKSQIRMTVQRESQKRFSEAEWRNLLSRPALRSRGDYLNNIPRWDAQFDHDQLLYLPFGQISANPAAVLRAVEDHCDLPRQKYSRLQEKIHATESFLLPDYVLEQLQQCVVEQNRFLENRFGTAFLKNAA